MKIVINSPGDPSVGIAGGTATVEIVDFENWFLPDAKESKEECRENTRDILKQAFEQIFDDHPVSVSFEDELFIDY